MASPNTHILTSDMLIIKELSPLFFVGDAISHITSLFEQVGITSARLDAEVLISHILQTDRTGLYLKTRTPLTNDAWRGIIALSEKRACGIPIAYLLRKKEFYSLDFFVDDSVLIPRPETEILVQETSQILELLPRNKEKPLLALEVGAGSGAISVALACNIDNLKIIATDISSSALAVARKNINHHRLSDTISFLCGNLYDPIRDLNQFDCIISNPPYVSTKEMSSLPTEVKNEPHVALYGGDEGLDVILPLVLNASRYLKPEGYVLFEIGATQNRKIKKMLSTSITLELLYIREDYSGVPRVVVAKRK